MNHETNTLDGRSSPNTPTPETAQVCLNGHLITARAVSQPESRRERCPHCNEVTISECLACNAAIPGWQPGAAVYGARKAYRVPNFCANCNQSHPWLLRTLRDVSRTYRKLPLTLEENAVLKADLLHLVIETQRSILAARRTRETVEGLDPASWEHLRWLLCERLCDTARLVWEPA